MAVRTYLFRVLFVGAYVAWVLALTSPMANSTATEPVVGGVTGIVSDTVSTVTEVASTVDPVVTSEPVEEAATTLGGTTTEAVDTATGAVDTNASSSQVANSAGGAVGTSGTGTTSGASTEITGSERGPNRLDAQSRKSNSRSGGGSPSKRDKGDDMEDLMGAGNDVVTVAAIGDYISGDDVVAQPGKSRGSQLALTGGSILILTMVGFILFGAGTVTRAAAKVRRPAVA